MRFWASSMTSSASRPTGPLLDEIARQIVQQVRFAAALPGVEPEIEHHRLDEVARFEHRVHQPRDRGLVIEPSQRRLQHGRLARSDLARNHDEAGVSFDAVPQVAQGFLVHPACVQVIGVRAERERPLAKVEEAFIHGGASFRMPRLRRFARRAPPAGKVRRLRRSPAAPRCTRASSLRENRFRSTDSRGSRPRVAAAGGRTRRTPAAAIREHRRRR